MRWLFSMLDPLWLVRRRGSARRDASVAAAAQDKQTQSPFKLRRPQST